MKEIKQLTSGLDMKCSKRSTCYDALLQFVSMQQGSSESVDNWLKRVESNADALIVTGGDKFLSNESLMENGINSSDEERQKEANKFKALVAAKRANQEKFGKLQKTLLENTHLGYDECPESILSVHDLLMRHMKTFEQQRRGPNRDFRSSTSRRQFAQHNSGDSHRTPVAGTDGQIINGVTCCNCNQPGHLSRNCPEP